MSLHSRAGNALFAGAVLIVLFGAEGNAQQTRYPGPRELPNPYRLVQGWPTIPASMNGGHWGEVIRVHVAHDGNVWVFQRCFNTVPPGHATCINRGTPIRRFWNSIHPANCSRASARGCLPIRTVSPSTTRKISG